MGKREVRVGMVGYKFMGKAHSHAYRELPMVFPQTARPVMKRLVDRRAPLGQNKRGVENNVEQ